MATCNSGGASKGSKIDERSKKSKEEQMVESLGDEITDYDWMMWAEDSWAFEAAILGEKFPTKSSSDGHTYDQYEIDRIKKIAPKIKEATETNLVTLDGETYGTLYRGEYAENLSEALKIYSVGKTITNSQLTSYALKSHIAKDYAEGYFENMGIDSGVKIIIKNTNKYGKSVGAVTDPFGAGGSYEAITPIGMKSKVKSVDWNSKTSTLFVEMENSMKPKKK